jgi:hypothetical protein
LDRRNPNLKEASGSSPAPAGWMVLGRKIRDSRSP